MKAIKKKKAQHNLRVYLWAMVFPFYLRKLISEMANNRRKNEEF